MGRRGRPVPPETVRAECLAVCHASGVAEDGRLDEIDRLNERVETLEGQIGELYRRIGKLTRERDAVQKTAYALQEDARRLNTVHVNVAAEGLMEIEASGRGLVGQTAAA